jgi:hypothetical protein
MEIEECATVTLLVESVEMTNSTLLIDNVEPAKVSNDIIPSSIIEPTKQDSKSTNRKSKGSKENTNTLMSTLNDQREKFHNKLINLLNENKSLINDVWIVNQQIIPLASNVTNNQQCGFLKFKYLTPENDYSVYSYILKAVNQYLFNVYEDEDFSESSSKLKEQEELINSLSDLGMDNMSIPIDKLHADYLLSSPNINETPTNYIQKNHVHLCYAFNRNAMTSLPLIVFPRNEFDVNISDKPIQNTVCIGETQNGELNDLNLFFKWLKMFVRQRRGGKLSTDTSSETNTDDKKPPSPLILLLNSFIQVVLIKNSPNLDLIKDLIKFCKQENVHLLFYPLQTNEDIINKQIFIKFKDTWKQILMGYAQKDNPHTQLAFVQIIKQTIRRLISILNSDLIKECYQNLFMNLYKMPFDLQDELSNGPLNDQLISNLTNPNTNGSYVNGGDQSTDEFCEEENSQTINSNGNGNNGNVIYPKLSEQEINDVIEWIDSMSKIGSLCIKYTYLRELYLKNTKTTKHQRDLLASERRWLELCKKNKDKFKYKYSCGINENEYLSRWYDQDFWRMSYYNHAKLECKLDSNESLWTFDIIQFPYQPYNSLLKAPEKDYKHRPKNFKPRISVIFAFNAAGDYLQPFFVYPLNFNNEEDKDSKNECFSQNGFVTCRIFEVWLTKSFLPYLRHKTDNLDKNIHYLLLYCAKLAVIDETNLKIIQQNNNRLSIFAMTQNENMTPFNLLFQKNLRKRQVDLFMDSWRKATAQLNMSYHFKCTSKAQFFNVFMNAFQNCIEEIGNNRLDLSHTSMTQVELNSSNSSNSAVEEFRIKMNSSFEACQLWPLDYDNFKQNITNAQQKLNDKSESMETDIKKIDQIVQDETNNEDTYDNVDEHEEGGPEQVDEEVEQVEETEEDIEEKDVSQSEIEIEPIKKRPRLSLNSVSNNSSIIHSNKITDASSNIAFREFRDKFIKNDKKSQLLNSVKINNAKNLPKVVITFNDIIKSNTIQNKAKQIIDNELGVYYNLDDTDLTDITLSSRSMSPTSSTSSNSSAILNQESNPNEIINDLLLLILDKNNGSKRGPRNQTNGNLNFLKSLIDKVQSDLNENILNDKKLNQNTKEKKKIFIVSRFTNLLRDLYGRKNRDVKISSSF